MSVQEPGGKSFSQYSLIIVMLESHDIRNEVIKWV
jgi:hypothetical protein